MIPMLGNHIHFPFSVNESARIRIIGDLIFAHQKEIRNIFMLNANNSLLVNAETTRIVIMKSSYSVMI